MNSMNRICFAMIGSQKCGTSTVLAALRSHPQIWMDDHDLFPHGSVPGGDTDLCRRRVLAGSGGKPIVGSMFPTFAASDTGSAHRACFGAELKLLMTVRDPVKRAISNYWMEVNRNWETGAMNALRDPGRGYLRRGLYHVHLTQFLKHYPRESLLIVRLEDMAQRLESTIAEMVAWIGADPFHDGVVHSRRRVGTYHGDPPPELVEFLAEHYAEPNRRLHDDFGIRIDDWTTP